MIFKMSFRNVVRMPKRTALLASIIAIVAAVISACALIYTSAQRALTDLYENYVFVASVIPNENITSSGDSEVSTKLTAANLEKVLDSNDYSAYNVSVANSYMYLPNELAVHGYPSGVAEEYPDVWKDSSGCGVTVTNNLLLEREFFGGKFRIVEGRDMSPSAYAGDAPEIVVPKWLADSFSLSVGDNVVASNLNGAMVFYRFIGFTVVGIYDAEDPDDVPKSSMSAYIPLQVWKSSAEVSAQTKKTGIVSLIRADFVVDGREGFDRFVKNAEKNGFDFSAANIIFNNSSYDRLNAELSNVSAVAVIVMTVVLTAGGGIFLFFCVYFRLARGVEANILRALGMKKTGVALMFALEIIVTLAVFAPLGAVVGNFGARGIVSYVDGTVIEEANALASIKQAAAENSSISSLILPLEREVSVSIGGDGIIASVPEFNPAYTDANADEYVVCAEEKWYRTHGTTYKNDYDNEWDEITIVGVSDLSFFGADEQLLYDAIAGKEYYPVYAYVSRDSGLSPGDYVRVSRRGIGDYCNFSYGSIDYRSKTVSSFTVIGYYEDNPYFGGSDVLCSFDGILRLNPTYITAINATGVIEK